MLVFNLKKIKSFPQDNFLIPVETILVRVFLRHLFKKVSNIKGSRTVKKQYLRQKLRKLALLFGNFIVRVTPFAFSNRKGDTSQDGLNKACLCMGSHTNAVNSHLLSSFFLNLRICF